MKIVDISSIGTKFSKIAMEHNGESLHWNLKYYDKQAALETNAVFNPINSYWESLPVDIQGGIFQVYKDMREVIDTVPDLTMLQMRMTQLVKELYAYMPYEDISKWAGLHVDIRIPPSITETYGELEISERQSLDIDYSAMTYLRSDYIDMIKMAIAFKPMVPIWAEYAKALIVASGFREYYAMAILAGTELFDIEPMKRFRRYIEASSPSGGTALSAALGGLGSSEIPDWYISMVIIRKLALVDVSTSDVNNIVSIVYRYVIQVTKQMEKKFSGQILDKPKASGESGTDDDKSQVERYKIKQPISDGDLIKLSVFTENTFDMAIRLCPDIDRKMVTQCIESVRELEHEQPTDGQMTLLRWILSPILSPNALDNINKYSLLSCFATGQAVLWHNGYFNLALLLTANELRAEDGTLLGGVEFQGRISKELVNIFTEMYPYYQVIGNKKERQTNVACKAIDALAREFVKCDWRVHAHKELISACDSVDDSKIMYVPSDIRIQLSKLIIDLVNDLNRGEE